MKLFILWDMEGVSGLFTRERVWHWEDGVRPHIAADFQINGQSVGEIGIETCVAGHFDIPLILVQGDAATESEVNDQFPDAVTANVKRAIDHDRCTGPDPEAARQITTQKVKEAIQKLQDRPIKPYKPELPMTVTVTYTSAEAAEWAAKRAGIQRPNANILQGHVAQQCDVVKWILGTGLP